MKISNEMYFGMLTDETNICFQYNALLPVMQSKKASHDLFLIVVDQGGCSHK